MGDNIDMDGKILKGFLPDLAKWERAKKNKIYPAGCTCLQVSATKGQLAYLHEDSKVESKYCVIMPNADKIEPFFLYRVIEAGMPEYLAKHQTGLNIKPEILKRFPVKWYEDRETQKYIAEEQYACEQKIANEEQILEQLKELKKWMLSVMFPGQGQNVPDLRFKDFA